MGTGRYLIILLIGCIVTSCTKEVIKIIDASEEVEKSAISIKISMASAVNTRSAWDYDAYFPSETPTDEESKVTNILLVIFKNMVLEEYAMYEEEGDDFTTDDNNILLHKTAQGEDEIDLEPGVHYFYAIINIPQGLYQVIKPQLENGKFSLTKEVFEKQLMDVNFAYLKGEATSDNSDNGFIMTNSTPPVATIVYSESQCVELGKTNEITIPVGRALAKVSLAYVPAKTGELHGALKDITYTVVNHPSQMYLMPVIENDKLITPHYNETNIDPDYFIYPIGDALKEPITATWLRATTEKTENGDYEYCIENNVKNHLKSNSTGLVIRGKFEPVQWLKPDGTTGTPTTTGTFWRIAQIDEDGYLLTYIKGYYNASPQTLATSMGSNFVVKEYPGGICYYAFYPSSNDEHQIKRNDFYKIVITHIHGAGAPGIDEIVNPDVDPDPKPTWGNLDVYSMGWDDYPQIETIGEAPISDGEYGWDGSIIEWKDKEQNEELGGNNPFN